MDRLKFKDGWNGGQFTPFLRPGTTLKIKIEDQWYQATVIEIYGYDQDHGHEYDWANIDLQVGSLKASLRGLLDTQPPLGWFIKERVCSQ